MWTPEGRAKRVHNSEVPTPVKLPVGVATGSSATIGLYKNGPDKKCPQWWGVHKSGVSIGRGSTVYLGRCLCLASWLTLWVPLEALSK